jgi:hypothetical protein
MVFTGMMCLVLTGFRREGVWQSSASHLYKSGEWLYSATRS